MSEPLKFQRRTVLVKRSLQLRYIGMVFLSVLISSLIVGGDIYYSIAHRVLAVDPSLATVINQFNMIILAKLAIYLGLMVLISLYVSHRFAGPIYRFEKSAQAVAGGDLTHRVSLRTGDELLELQEEFNAMLASLQSMVQKDRTLSRHLLERLEAALKKLPEGAAAAAAREELESVKLELEHLTSSFKV
ncbi:MAG: methyl-accepting chemotaxis protein [Elusimicrobia bacterium]|nr:methyl-accepting chemotaxis protein [Elusimicrobiota bacterium]